jgi:hypothetical protein
MRVKYLDLKTGKTAWAEGVSQFSLTYGEDSCDCNRIFAFSKSDIISNEEAWAQELCRCQRFIAIELQREKGEEEFEESDVLREANSEYFVHLAEWYYLEPR